MRGHRGAAVAAVVALLLAALPSVAGSPAALGPPPTPLSAPLGLAASPIARGPPGVAAAVGPMQTPANVLVDVPCNATGGNAEVQSAFDPSVGYLYETWIGCGGIGFSRSTDNGSTFDPAFAVPGSMPAGGGSWDPAIAVAPNGTVYVAFMVSVPYDGPVVAWSYDHGATFAGYAYAFNGSANEFSDRDFIAVAPNGTVYVTWDYSPNAAIDSLGCASGASCYFVTGDYNVVCVASSDGGHNWSAPSPIDPEYPNGGAVAAPLLVEPNGSVDVLYEDYNISANSSLLGVGYNYFTRSTDGGRTWSPPVRVSHGNDSFPNTAWWIDGTLSRGRDGTLWAAWNSDNGTSSVAWLAYSVDGGSAWAVVRVNPDVNGAAHIMATAVGAENGTAFVAWMSNNSSGYWSTFEVPFSVLGGYGTIVRVSASLGIPGYWVGDTIGVAYLGHNDLSTSWTYGVTQGPSISSQVFEAVVLGTAPAPPRIESVIPGQGTALVTWNDSAWFPVPTGYRVEWGTEGSFASNLTVPAPNRSLDLTGLLAFAAYSIRVLAIDSAGVGPPSMPVNVTLTAWTQVAGSVIPANARVNLDGVPITTIGGDFSVRTTYAPHALSAVADGYAPGAAVALPLWNGTVTVLLDLSLLNGTVAGTLAPAVALLTWDGAPVPVQGNGAFSIAATPNVLHDLRATYPGLIGYEENVTVAANSTLWRNITLAPEPGTLAFSVFPANATLTVGSAPVALDASGNGSVSVAPGTYAWHAVALGYDPEWGNVTAISGQVVNVSVRLTWNVTTGGGGGGSAWLSNATLATLLIGTTGLLALAVVLLLARRRRPPEPETGELRVVAEPVEESEGLPETPADAVP